MKLSRFLALVVLLALPPMWCLCFIVGFMNYQQKPTYHWKELKGDA
jgi:hypothetical protein